jgi:hypothetical protein
MVSPKMDLIILNLVLMSHKFDANVSILVLMPKKTGGGGHYNFIFSQIMFYVRLKKRQENLRGEPLAFSFLNRVTSFYISELLHDLTSLLKLQNLSIRTILSDLTINF